MRACIDWLGVDRAGPLIYCVETWDCSVSGKREEEEEESTCIAILIERLLTYSAQRHFQRWLSCGRCHIWITSQVKT
jgi:hypothetical protein